MEVGQLVVWEQAWELEVGQLMVWKPAWEVLFVACLRQHHRGVQIPGLAASPPSTLLHSASPSTLQAVQAWLPSVFACLVL